MPIPIPGWIPHGPAAVMGAVAHALPPLRPTADRLRVASGVTYLGTDAKARSELGFDPRTIQDGLPDAARAILEDLIEEGDL